MTRTLNHITTLLLLSICFLTSLKTLQGQQFRNYIEIGQMSSNLSPKIAIDSFEIRYKKGIAAKDTSKIVIALIGQSAVYRALFDFSTAFEKSGKALFLAEETNNYLLKAKAHEEFGVLQYLFVQDELSGKHFKISYNNYLKAYKSGKIKASEKYRAYYNMILHYLRINENDLAKNYIDSCYSVINPNDSYGLYDVYLNEKKAIILARKKQYDKANQLLKYGIDRINKLKDIPTNQKHRSFLIVLYTVLANHHKLNNEFQTSYQLYEKALNTIDYNGEYEFYRSYIHVQFADLLYNNKKFDMAYQNLLKAKTINDQYLNPRNKHNQDFLLLRNQYEEEISNKNDLLNEQTLQLAKNKQHMLQLRILLIVAISIIIVSGMLIRSRWTKLKHQKEKDLSEQKQKMSLDMLQSKNVELSNTMLKLIEKQVIINKLEDHLAKNYNNSSTRSLLGSIQQQSSSLWESFNNRFIEQNEDFYEKLKQKVPDLSNAELKICALIKLNFTGKEMAHLLGISHGSVHVARHRLRKKLNIDKDTNLTKFINSI